MSSFFWGIYARWYDLLRTLHSYQRLHDRVVELLQMIPHLRILDAGCGTGNTVEKILGTDTYGTYVVGFDPTPHMLARAKQKIRSGAVRFTNSLEKSERFDRIISINSFYTMSNHEEIAKEWYNRLEDGGLLVIANPFRPKLFDIFGEHFAIAWQRKDLMAFVSFALRLPLWTCLIVTNLIIAKRALKKVYAFFPPEKLDQILLGVGFIKLSTEEIYGNTDILCSYQKDEGKTVRRAQTTSEITQTLALRYEVYCRELVSLDGRLYAANLEYDRFDQYAIHFIARGKGGVIGCVRLIRDAKKELLLEEQFNLPEHLKNERAGLIELSRWVVKDSFRGTGLWYDLAEAAIAWATEHGYTSFVMAARKSLWDGLKKRGHEVKLWEGYQQYHGTSSAPGSIGCRTL